MPSLLLSPSHSFQLQSHLSALPSPILRSKRSVPSFSEGSKHLPPTEVLSQPPLLRGTPFRPKPSSLLLLRRAAKKHLQPIDPDLKMTEVDVRPRKRLHQRPKSANNPPSSYTNGAGAHFRPVDFDTNAQLEAFFGLTKAQKRERALHVQDTDGRMYYDTIEKDEWAGLLTSSSPTFASRRSSSVVSLTSSPGGYLRRTSLANVGFVAIDDKDLFPSPFMTAKPVTHRGVHSDITSPMGVSFGSFYMASEVQRSASNEGRIALVGRRPSHTDPGSPIRRTRQRRSNSAVLRANTVTDALPIDLPSRFSPTRPHVGDPYMASFARRRSCTNGSPAVRSSPSIDVEGNSPAIARVQPVSLQAATPIRLPAFLGREKTKATPELLDLAFTVPEPQNEPSVSFSDPFNGDHTEPVGRAQRPSDPAGPRHRPAPLQFVPHAPLNSILATSSPATDEGFAVRSAPRSARGRPFSMHVSPSHSSSILSTLAGDSEEASRALFGALPASSGSGTWSAMHWSPVSVSRSPTSASPDMPLEASVKSGRVKCTPEAAAAATSRTAARCRRRSSFDFASLRRRSLTFLSGGSDDDFGAVRESTSASSPLPSHTHRKTPSEQTAKAEAVLGMTQETRGLLVPGDLGTGLEVYDGVPCPSVYLASDDENDEDQVKGKGNKKWWKRK